MDRNDSNGTGPSLNFPRQATPLNALDKVPLGLNRNATKTRRQYSREFKCDAVRRVLDHGLPIARVARDLGVAESVISRWVATVRDHGEGALTGEAPTAEQLELRRLQIENQALRHERDLLRKAAALFAKDLSL